MSVDDKQVTKKLLIRALAPSVNSVFWGLFLSVFITIWQFTRDQTGSLGETETLQSLESIVTRPVELLLHNDSFNSFVLAVIFGLVGFTFYILIELFVNVYQGYKNQKTLVHFEDKNSSSPSRPIGNTLKEDWGWRILITLLLINFTLISQAMFSSISMSTLFRDQTNAIQFIVTVITYALVLHFYLVFLRLYLRRTRVFEELIY